MSALLSGDIGFLYLETTTDAAGKLVWWNGNKWVDSAGTVV